MKNLTNKIILLTVSLSLFSCSSSPKFPLLERKKLADQIALKADLKKSIITTNHYSDQKISDAGFNITAYFRVKNPELKSLNVYIEGDGYAFKNRHTVSDNPTPINPIALRLAVVDPNPNILYVARPCQYTSFSLDKNCEAKFWTGSRLSKTVIYSINDVIERLVKKYDIKTINIYGFSGGGAAAVLVASIRNDVASIKTIAANLNHKDLAKFHDVTPLADSLDAIDFVEKIKTIPQTHIAAEKDKIIPYKFIESFTSKINNTGGNAKFILIKNATHDYEEWPELWRKLNVN